MFWCFRLFYVYATLPHNHISWARSIPFASINSSNPRTNLWNLCKNFLKIVDFEKFWVSHFFASSPWISVKGSWSFDDYPGFQQKTTHPKHLSCKKCAIKQIIPVEKKSDIEKWLWKSEFDFFLTRPKCFAKLPKVPIIGENCWLFKTIWKYGLSNVLLPTFITLLSRPLRKKVNPSIPAFV